MMTKWDTIQADVADAYRNLDDVELEQPPLDDFDDVDDEELARVFALSWDN